jgi:hypothetical protein
LTHVKVEAAAERRRARVRDILAFRDQLCSLSRARFARTTGLRQRRVYELADGLEMLEGERAVIESAIKSRAKATAIVPEATPV